MRCVVNDQIYNFYKEASDDGETFLQCHHFKAFCHIKTFTNHLIFKKNGLGYSILTTSAAFLHWAYKNYWSTTVLKINKYFALPDWRFWLSNEK